METFPKDDFGGVTVDCETTARKTTKPLGIKPWLDDKSIFSIYFRTDRAAEFNLSLRLKVPEGKSVIRASAASRVFEKKITGSDAQVVPLGAVSVKTAGYVRVDLQGLRRTGPVFAEVGDLLVGSATADLKLDYVKDSAENRFYWGRRGPSVHLGYEVPAGKTIEYFYNEVTVPQGQDPIGSYFTFSIQPSASEGQISTVFESNRESRTSGQAVPSSDFNHGPYRFSHATGLARKPMCRGRVDISRAPTLLGRGER